jgi:hypothetical protein
MSRLLEQPEQSLVGCKVWLQRKGSDKVVKGVVTSHDNVHTGVMAVTYGAKKRNGTYDAVLVNSRMENVLWGLSNK